ncbi:MAG: hypothetical protein EXR71_10285 [Myxococcales bacterium]|nr:hypothetical protein [Myxococcales bacterium]
MISTLLFASLALAAPVRVATWTASTTAPPNEARSFDVNNLGDGKQSTAWAEGEDGAGLGSWVVADFGAPKTITAITVWGSSWYNTEYFGHYNRPKTVVAEYGDGTTEEFTAADAQTPQVLKLKSPKNTQTVKMRIKGIYAGKGVDTAISEVRFSDNTTDGPVAVAGAVASSSATADTDGTYDANNAVDGIADSMWCEGNLKSDGTGEWLELTLGRRSTVSALKVRAGAAPELFKAVNRPVSATVSFGDGAKETLSFKDFPFEQTLSFAAHTTDKLKIQFTAVKKGETYDDLCVSEITVVP